MGDLIIRWKQGPSDNKSTNSEPEPPALFTLSLYSDPGTLWRLSLPFTVGWWQDVRDASGDCWGGIAVFPPERLVRVVPDAGRGAMLVRWKIDKW